MFNSYVKLPEGNNHNEQHQQPLLQSIFGEGMQEITATQWNTCFLLGGLFARNAHSFLAQTETTSSNQPIDFEIFLAINTSKFQGFSMGFPWFCPGFDPLIQRHGEFPSAARKMSRAIMRPSYRPPSSRHRIGRVRISWVVRKFQLVHNGS